MTELLKKRYIVSFIFDASCDTSKIATSGNEAYQHYVVALLRQFLAGDSDKIKRLIGQHCALELGTWNIDDIEAAIVSPVLDNADDNALSLFGEAIETLPPAEREWWQDVVVNPDDKIGEAVETIFDSFQVRFASAQLQEAIPVKTIDALTATQDKDEDFYD